MNTALEQCGLFMKRDSGVPLAPRPLSAFGAEGEENPSCWPPLRSWPLISGTSAVSLGAMRCGRCGYGIPRGGTKRTGSPGPAEAEKGPPRQRPARGTEVDENDRALGPRRNPTRWPLMTGDGERQRGVKARACMEGCAWSQTWIKWARGTNGEGVGGGTAKGGEEAIDGRRMERQRGRG